MHGEIEEELEGTELAAEFSFSSLQKFGQEFLKKLRAKKMPNKLLQKVRNSLLIVGGVYARQSLNFTKFLLKFLLLYQNFVKSKV